MISIYITITEEEMVSWQQYDADIAPDTTMMGIQAYWLTAHPPARNAFFCAKTA